MFANNTRHKIVVLGPSRSGTTLLASILSQLGVNFGLQRQDWDVNSGYYEHPAVLGLYGDLRKADRLGHISDRIARFYLNRAEHALSNLLPSVSALKYPPISCRLPHLVAKAGFTPLLAISARRFEPHAISRVRKEGVGYEVCKRDYLETYRTAQLLLSLYKGEVISYEGMLGDNKQPAIESLSSLSGAPLDLVCSVADNSVGLCRSKSSSDIQEDHDCGLVYENLMTFVRERHVA